MYYRNPLVLNFSLFHSTASSFWVTRHFENGAPDDPKMTLNSTRSNVPQICGTGVPHSQIQSVLLYRQDFLSYWPIWDNWTKWPRTWEGQMYPIHVLLVSTSTKFHSTTSHFQDTGHFETSAPNDPKIMNLNPTRSNVPHMYHWCPRVFSVLFILQEAIFELHAILRKVDWMTPQMTLNPTRSNVSHIVYVLLVSMHLKFHSMTSCFSNSPFWDKCTKRPKMTLNTTRSNVPYICVTTVPNSPISVRFAPWPAVFELQAILKKSTLNDAKMTLNSTRSNVPHIFFYINK